MDRRARGFTLIELMLVVAIISLLAAIAIPKFADLLIRAKEAGVKGKTGGFRSALRLYYADNEGTMPAFGMFVEESLVPKYLSEIPTITIPTVGEHIPSNRVGWSANDWAGDRGWFYSPGSTRIIINCDHADSKGSTWSLF